MASRLGIEATGRTIGELAALSGCPLETVRYYERAGVIPEPPRTAGGRRLYGDEHVHRLQFVRRARELGFSLERTKRLLRLSERPEASCGEAQDIAKAHLHEVRQRLAELRRIEATLSRMVGECANAAVQTCPIVQPLCTGAAVPGDQASG